jgi:hypothetical protein
MFYYLVSAEVREIFYEVGALSQKKSWGRFFYCNAFFKGKTTKAAS